MYTLVTRHLARVHESTAERDGCLWTGEEEATRKRLRDEECLRFKEIGIRLRGSGDTVRRRYHAIKTDFVSYGSKSSRL